MIPGRADAGRQFALITDNAVGASHIAAEPSAREALRPQDATATWASRFHIGFYGGLNQPASHAHLPEAVLP